MTEVIGRSTVYALTILVALVLWGKRGHIDTIGATPFTQERTR